jgi:hypothetical protein
MNLKNRILEDIELVLGLFGLVMAIITIIVAVVYAYG